MTGLPSDIATRIDSLVTAGYDSPEAVLREALAALEHRDADLAAIREGMADEETRRTLPARQAMAKIRARHGLTGS